MRPPAWSPAWFEPLVDGYLGSLRRRGRSEKTIATYRYQLGNFGAYLVRMQVPNLVDLRLGDVEQWQDEMASKWDASSRQVATIAVKGVLEWCERGKLALHTEDMHRRIDGVSVPENDPRPIPRTDLAVILRALRDPARSEAPQLRDRALFLALLSSGSRIGAVLSLDRDSIVDGVAMIRQKGNRPHTLVFSDEAVAAVRQYLEARGDEHRAMFVSHRKDIRGRELRPTRLIHGSVNRAWSRLAAELDVAPWTSHQIRHTTATELLRRKVDVVTIQRHMGWRNLAQITTYARVDLDQRREAVAALSVG